MKWEKIKKAFCCVFFACFPHPSGSVEVVSKVGAAMPLRGINTPQKWCWSSTRAWCGEGMHPAKWRYGLNMHWLSEVGWGWGIKWGVSPFHSRRTDLRQNHRKWIKNLIASAVLGLPLLIQEALVAKNLSAHAEHIREGFNPWVRKMPWRRAWQPIPILLPGKPHGQRSLVGCSPRGRRVRHNWSYLMHTDSWSSWINKEEYCYYHCPNNIVHVLYIIETSYISCLC